MKHLLLIILTAGFFAACNTKTNSDSKQEANNSAETDSVYQKEDEMIAPFKKEFSVPLTIDTAFINSISQGNSIGRNAVLKLSSGLVQGKLQNGCEWHFNDFCKIDSFKSAGKYEEYCAGLDIGSTKASDAYAVGRIPINPQTVYLIWAIACSSYEACPYFAGTSVFVSVYSNGKITSSSNIAEINKSGDPPVSMERTVISTLHADGKITVEAVQINDEDMDQPRVERVTEHYEFLLKDGALAEKTDAYKTESKKIKRAAK